MSKPKDGLFSKFKRKTDAVKKTGGQEFPAIRQKVYDAIKNNDQTENAIINYVLTQAASDKVSFATKAAKPMFVSTMM